MSFFSEFWDVPHVCWLFQMCIPLYFFSHFKYSLLLPILYWYFCILILGEGPKCYKLPVPQNLDLPLLWIQDLWLLVDFVIVTPYFTGGRLKLKGGSQVYVAKLGQDPGLPTPNLMLFSFHSVKRFDDLSVNNGQGALDIDWVALGRLKFYSLLSVDGSSCMSPSLPGTYFLLL